MNYILKKVIEARINKLKESIDETLPQTIAEENQFFNIIIQYIEKIQVQKDDNFSRFYSYLLIQYSRIFEAFSCDHNGNKRFIISIGKFKSTTPFLQVMFFQFAYTIKYLFDDDSLSIKPFNDQAIIDQVKENLKQNIEVVQIIMMQPVTFDDIDNYFKQAQIFVFDGLTQFHTQGLASFDGQYLYINQFYCGQRYIYKLLESAAMDNFYFWLIKNTNPFLIFPEINKLLIDKDDIQIEASDFYSLYAYNNCIHLPNPFRMITLNYKPYL